MLHFRRWQVIGILAVVLLGFLAVIPNFLSKETLAAWPSFLPKSRLVLGLDLQGGAYLLYEVDRNEYMEKRLRDLTSEVRRTLLENPRIGYTGLGVQAQTVQLRIRDLTQLADAKTRLNKLRNPLNSGLLSAGSVYEFDLTVGDDGLVRFGYSPAGLAQRLKQIVQQSIQVIDRRINDLGTTEPSIQQSGDGRILVEAPGLGDPQRLKDLVGQTAQLEFHMVNDEINPDQAKQTPPKPGITRFPDQKNTNVIYEVDEGALMTGEDLADAQTAFDQQTNEPIVSFRLTGGGAQKFGQVTTKNVGRPFAIVLDNVVISAPVIRQPILGGSGQISGNFTVESANDLAILLRAGSLPAKLTIVEERSVGASLGADSIHAGIMASIVATAGIAIFMIVCYGLLGFFADLAVAINVAMIFGVLSLLGATLTLPGIAGVVLTVGIAVDSNVLI